MIKYFEFEAEIEKIQTILDQLNKNRELNIDKIKNFICVVSLKWG